MLLLLLLCRKGLLTLLTHPLPTGTPVPCQPSPLQGETTVRTGGDRWGAQVKSQQSVQRSHLSQGSTGGAAAAGVGAGGVEGAPAGCQCSSCCVPSSGVGSARPPHFLHLLPLPQDSTCFGRLLFLNMWPHLGRGPLHRHEPFFQPHTSCGMTCRSPSQDQWRRFGMLFRSALVPSHKLL